MYTFEMDESESFAKVLLDGVEIATIQNDYFGGLNMSQSGLRNHPYPFVKVSEDMWEEFYDWTETLEQSK